MKKMKSVTTDWPTIDDLSTFLHGADLNDEALRWALDAAIDYGRTTLGDGWADQPSPSVFNGCLDYAASLFSSRTGNSDIYADPQEGSTPQQRYRRLLLASRYVGFA